MQAALFTPLELRSLALKNRIVVAPMLTYAAPDGRAGDWHLMHLGRFVAGGAGLVIMEATAIEDSGRTSRMDLGLWSDAQIAPLARVTAFARGFDVPLGLQLNHAGRKRKFLMPWEPPEAMPPVRDGDLVGPSAVAHAAGLPVPREASRSEIQGLVVAWGEAARRAAAAGFDLLELHGAHGYLLHQFLSLLANRRQDAYGGDLRGRMRFVLEVIEAVRAAWPSGKPLFLRLSCVDDAGWTLEDSIVLARAAAALGVDAIDCSSGGMGGNVLEARRIPYGYQVPYAARIRAEAGVRTLAVGLIVHADQAETILSSGQADLVALAREFLHNPNWPMDAAQKLGALPSAPAIPRAYGYWLDKRAANNVEVRPSTWQRGLADRLPDGKREDQQQRSAQEGC